MVTKDPPRNGRISPAMMAEIRPQIGGAPEATAMPSENGTEINDTTSPAARSCLQCFRPAMPLRGSSFESVEPTCMRGEPFGEEVESGRCGHAVIERPGAE